MRKRKALQLAAGVVVGAAVAVLVWRPWARTTREAGPGAAQTQPAPAELLQANNRGVGLMGQFDYEKAAAVFSDLSARRPDWVDARVNLAIATLNRQREGDEEAALQLLAAVQADDPGNLRARYCSGLLLLRRGKLDEAKAQLIAVAQADPSDAYAAYYTGECFFQEGDYAQSLAWHERALKADPALRSAYYGAAQSLRQLGKVEEFKQKLAEFERLKDNPQARLAEYKYTRMGPKAEAVTSLPPGVPPPPAPAAPQGPMFLPAAPLPVTGAEGVTWAAADPALGPPGITGCDIDGDGSLDLFITGGVMLDGRRANAVLLNRGGSFQLDTKHPLARVPDVTAALWGDVDNDGLTDAYLCRRGPGRLWRQTKQGEWSDVTASSKVDAGDYHTTDGAIYDADHDGDLDLVLIARSGPVRMPHNNGDGTFRPLPKDLPPAGDRGAAVGLVVADFDSDRDADVLALHEGPSHVMYTNDLAWNYRPGSGAENLLTAPADAAVAADADADGRVEIYTASGGALSRWSRDASGVWQRAAVGPALPAAEQGKARLAVADLTGTGALALICSDGHGWRAVGLGAAPLDSASGDTPLESWSLVTLNAAAGPAVVGVRSNQPPVIWQPGPGRHPFAAVRFSGRTNPGESMRSNASGIGTEAAARVGPRWTAMHTWRNQSGPGQSLQPLAFGLGGQPAIDFLRIEWSDGVSQTELALEAGKLHRIAETQRQLSSCPVLFAWDGSKYAFVTDLLGVGGIGYAVAPGEYATPRPFENVLLPEGLPRASADGRIRLKLAEPMEEACYLDAASLVAYDLPPGWQMVLDERMGISGPAPTGEARFYRRESSPIAATDAAGRDVLPAVRDADHVAAPVGPRDPRFIGRTAQEQAITLAFAEPLDAPGRAGAPMLVADGWVEYPYSQTMFAAWQAGADYRAPTLEARGADGRWHVVLEQFGYPAGMPRRMSVPIPRDTLPPGATHLRLRTNQEVYWDRLSVAWAEPCPQAKRLPLQLAKASVAFCGFPRRTTHAQQRPDYDYARRAPLWDTRHQSGWYTAFGPAEELLASADDALAVFGPGEEVHAEFTASGEGAAPPAAGWTRRHVLETVGWCKDMDLYTRTGETIDPMPARGEMTESQKAHRDALHRKYNTRYQSGG